jgi:lysozyme
MDDRQRAELAADEGTRLLVYDDATGRAVTPGYCMRGHPTVGVGRALDVHGLTAAEAEVLFVNDIAAVERALSAVPWYVGLDAVRQGVMVNLCFNLGLRGLLSFITMIADIESAEHDLALTLSLLAGQRFAAAAAELAASKWAHQVQPARRDRLIAQLRTGQLGPAPVDKTGGSSGLVDNRPEKQNPTPAPKAPAADDADARETAQTEALNEVQETQALNQAQIDKGRSP